MGWAQDNWSTVELELMRLPREPSQRQLLLLIEEVMVREVRASRLDFAARVPFTEREHSISETRGILREMLDLDPETEEQRQQKAAAQTMDAMAAMMGGGQIEFG